MTKKARIQLEGIKVDGKLVSWLAGLMKATFDLPDQLYRQAKSSAALQGRKVKDLVAEGLRLVLSRPGQPERPRQVKFPILKDRGHGILNIPDDVGFRAEIADERSRHEAGLR